MHAWFLRVADGDTAGAPVVRRQRSDLVPVVGR
jgi:hypothetical protein